jgi:hypothetical protein
MTNFGTACGFQQPTTPKGRFYFAATNEQFGEDRAIWFDIAPDCRPHTYRLDLKSHPKWYSSGTVAYFRFDPADDGFYAIESLKFYRF